MKKNIAILMFLTGVMLACDTANTQKFDSGRYLFFLAGQEHTPFTFDFADDGSIKYFMPDTEAMYIGKWSRGNQTLTLAFEDAQFRNFDGRYEVSQTTSNKLVLKSENTTLYALTFDESEMGITNARLGIQGTWKLLLTDEVTMHYTFKLPNSVEVRTMTNNKETDRQDFFWRVLSNGEDLILFPDIMMSHTGMFGDIKVRQNKVQFNCNGKQCIMTKEVTKKK